MKEGKPNAVFFKLKEYILQSSMCFIHIDKPKIQVTKREREEGGAKKEENDFVVYRMVKL